MNIFRICKVFPFVSTLIPLALLPTSGKQGVYYSNRWKRQRVPMAFMVLLMAIIAVCVLDQSVCAASQVLGGDEVENALRITCNDDGMRIEAFINNRHGTDELTWKGQTYADDKSCLICYENGGTFKYTAGYYDGLSMSCTLNTNLSSTVNRRVWKGGSVALTMDTTYTSPNRIASYSFMISNKSASILSNLKFFHGQDTYLGGTDSGGGYRIVSNNLVGVKKPSWVNPGTEIYQEMVGSIKPYRCCSLGYYDVKVFIEQAYNLGNIINTNYYIDNGYALQWNVDTLNPGETWTVDVYELFKVGGDFSLTFPSMADIGVSTVVTGQVRNGGDLNTTIYLDVTMDNGSWTSKISGLTSFEMAPGAISNILVNVSCPPVISVGEQAELTITLTNAAGESTTDNTTLTGVYYDGVVLVSGVKDDDIPQIAQRTDFGGHPVGAYVTNVFTLTNAGPLSVTMTNYALTGDTSQFSVSGLSTPLTLDAGATTNMAITYYYDGLGDHAATLTMQDNKPWTPFIMNLKGYTWAISTNSGPKRGGNEVVITNGNLGSGADINQVQVGGMNAEVLDQGTDWVSFIVPEQPDSGLVDVKINSISLGSKTMKDCYYVNPIGTLSSVSPATGYYTGGTVVTITGTNFCNGSLDDVTNVTFQGVAVTSIDSVAGSTQIVVTVAAALPGKATIVIESFTHGRCEFPGAFSFEGPDMFVYGKKPYSYMPNNEILNNSEPSEIKGSDAGWVAVDGDAIQNFTIINTNAADLHISTISTNGADTDAFEVVSLSSTTVVQNGAATLRVKFSPASAGSKTATIFIDSDAPDAPFLLNLACEGSDINPAQGPLVGGQTVTISNIDLDDVVSSIMVGGREAVIEHQGADWIRFVTPTGEWSGVKDVTLTGDGFTNVLNQGYIYSRKGYIHGDYTDDWSQWETLPDIPYGITQRSNMWFMGVGAYDDYVVAMGGSHTGICLTATYYYDEFEWARGPEMPQAWAGMGLAELNDTLHIVGGYSNTYPQGISTRSMGSNNYYYSYMFDGQHFVSNAAFSTSYDPNYMGVVALNGEVHAIAGCDANYDGGLDIYRMTNILSLAGSTWRRNGGLTRSVYHTRCSILSNIVYCVGAYGYPSDYSAMTNCWTFDGTTVTEIEGLPQALGRMAVGTVSGQVYAAGGSAYYYNSYTFSNRVYKLDGSSWTVVPSLQLPSNGGQFYGGVSVHDRFYALGPVSYAYPNRTWASGVSPTNCTAAGGVTVTISGRNLCDGTMGDVTSVLLAGNEVASIDSVSTTQIVVTAAAGSGAYGDVVVTSVKYGQTIASNAFLYTGIGIQIRDANGDLVVADQAVSTSAGTDYGYIPYGTPVTNWFSIVNTGDGTVNFSGVETNGSSVFQIGADFTLPATLAQGVTTNVPIVCDASVVGDLSATLYFNNDTVGASSNYPVNLSASVFNLSTNAGPFQGGQTITITNGNMGNNSDITAVYFYTFSATILDQGSNWVQVVTPATEWAMTCDVTVHSDSLGDTVLDDAYTYREQAWIGAINYSDGEWKEMNGPASTVLDMTIGPDGALYACGYFTNLCDGTYVPSRVAKYQYGVWTPVGTNILNSSVYCIEFFGTELYASGPFTRIDDYYDYPSYYKAKYDGTNWVIAFTNRLDSYARDLETDGTNLYFGGGFDYYGYTNVAVWNGATFVNMGDGITNDVYTLKYHDGYLYAGTDGSSIGEFARYTGAAWEHLTPYLDDGVFALAAAGSYVYFGGYFTYEDSGPMAYVGQWNGAAISGMAGGLSNRVTAMDTLHDGNIVAGYYQYGYVGGIPTVDNMAVWNGTGWVPCGNETAYYGTIDSLKAVYNGIYVGGDIRDASGGAISNCAFFSFAQTNTISPKTGSSAGGTSVTIPGYNLCNGTAGDVYNVTICGTDVASIDSVSSTQIMVTTAAGPGGPGDVVVYTYDYGTIVMSNAFTYDSGSGLKLWGTDGSLIEDGAAADVLAGTYGWAHPGSTGTNLLTIYNPGDQDLIISAVVTNGADAGLFDIELPNRVDVGTTSNVVVRYSPTADGTFTALVTVVNNTKGSTSNYFVNLKLGGYTSTADEGAWDGEGLMTISNGMLGSGSDISSVRVGDYIATVLDQGANWVQFRMPVASSSGVHAVYVDSDSVGQTIIPDAYHYYKGRLWGYTNNWDKWEDKPDMPLTLGHASAVVYNDKIYAHGRTNAVYSYTYGATNWEIEPDMPLLQVDSYYYSNRTLVVYKDNLMAVGGDIKYSNRLTNDCNLIFTGSEWISAGRFPVGSQMYWGNAAIKDDTLYYFGAPLSTPSNMASTTSTTGDWQFVFSGYPTYMKSMGAVTLSNRLFSLGGLRSTTVYSNVYEFNGTYWETNTIPGLPISLHSMGATVMDGQIYIMGGFDYGSYHYNYDVTNAYRFKDGSWEGIPGIKYAKGCPRSCTYNGQVYCIGGTYQGKQVYAYPRQDVHGGVLPLSGASTGGYQAVLSGFDLCNGTTADIERVTFGGADATVLSVEGTTQIIVQVAGGPFGPVDVKVYSTTCGITTSSNAFTFSGADITVLGTNGVEVTNGEAASRAKGTDFGTVQVSVPVSRTFVITNAGNEAMSISGIGSGGTVATQVVTDAESFPITLSGSSSTNLTVTWTADGTGVLDAFLVITNDTLGSQSNYIVNLSASVITLDRATYSEEGGGLLTITNGVALGNGADITNVMFGTTYVMPVAQGANWVQIVIPAGSIGTVSPITVQSFSLGGSTLIDAFSYVEAGAIYGSEFTWTELPGLPDPMQYNVAFVLNDQLYSAGGYSAASATNVYRFDGLAWHSAPGLPVANVGGMGAVYNGAFYYIGGGTPGGIVTNVYRFDATNWTETLGLPMAMAYGVAGIVDGKIAVAGGFDAGGSHLTNCFVYDGANWAEMPGLRYALIRQGAAVNRGKLYVFGGEDDFNEPYFNQYSFNGTNWSSEAGMPALLARMGGATLNRRTYSIGGVDGGGVTNLVIRYDGYNWSNVDLLPEKRCAMGAAFWRGAIYSIGGDVFSFNPQTNVWMLTDGGVSPIEGYPDGGFNVTINGTNLSAGTVEDITSVTICGATASVLNVYGSTQIVVTAGSGPVGVGDVVISSLSYGEITAENAFTYKRGIVTLIGTNGADIAQDDPASTNNGTDFGSMLVGQEARTNTFGIRNSGIAPLTLSAVEGAGAGGDSFTVIDFPTNTLLPGESGQIIVVCASLGGDQLGQITFRDNEPVDPFVPSLGGYTVSVYNVRSYGSGPGIDVTPTTLDYSATYGAANPANQTFDVSNVGSDPLTFSNTIAYAGAGENWLTVTPVAGSLGIGVSSTISNSVDITNLNVGAHIATVSVWCATATNSPQSCIVTLTVAKTTQTLTWSAPGQQTYTNETVLDAACDSGITPTYTVLSGPAVVHASGYPVVATYSSTGDVTIIASQEGNMNYDAANTITHTWAVTRALGQISLTNLTQEYTGSEITVDVVTAPTGITYDITYDGITSGPTNVGVYEVIATITDPLIYGGVTNTLTITKASQTITFPSIVAMHTNSSAGLSATGGGSGNAIAFNVLSGAAAISSLTNLDVLGAGDVLVTADQAGSVNYDAAPTVTNLVRVSV